MPTSFHAVLVAVVALVPGAMYIWAFERLAGRWGIGSSDRVFRFVGVSALFHVAAAPATYWFWTTQWPLVRRAEPLSWWLWGFAVTYVALPLLLGSLVGTGTRRRWVWVGLFTGPDPAPRARDYLFQGTRDGWIRITLKSGPWVGGAYATSTDGLQSHSAGYPEEPDIFLATTVSVDPETGAFCFGADGQIEVLDGGPLVRWNEVEHLEFIDAQGRTWRAEGSRLVRRAPRSAAVTPRRRKSSRSSRRRLAGPHPAPPRSAPPETRTRRQDTSAQSSDCTPARSWRAMTMRWTWLVPS